MIGVDYGYPVVLMGLIDTANSNFPCLNKEGAAKNVRGICIESEFIEILFPNLERLSKILAVIIGPALAQRVNMPLDTPIHEIYY